MRCRLSVEHIDPLKLEQYLIPAKNWKRRLKSMPVTCQEIVKGDTRTVMQEWGGSVGIGFYKPMGWFVLVTSGQGPTLAWAEANQHLK